MYKFRHCILCAAINDEETDFTEEQFGKFVIKKVKLSKIEFPNHPVWDSNGYKKHYSKERYRLYFYPNEDFLYRLNGISIIFGIPEKPPQPKKKKKRKEWVGGRLSESWFAKP